MNYVFVAVGGSGIKVAEALVRLLTVGFPTRQENGVLTSAGDMLRIWCVDSDISSGARIALNKALEDYKKVQDALSKTLNTDKASSQWAMDIEVEARTLNPSILNGIKYKTLGSLLAANNSLSATRLAAFYNEAELSAPIDGGFFQKPFIGAAVMPLFAASLKTNNEGNGKEAGLTDFANNEARFFLCGSLHGGTGACGVPTLGRFLKKEKQSSNKNWRIGCCLLAPYCKPSDPPFSRLELGKDLKEEIKNKMRDFGDKSPFSAIKSPEGKTTLVERILRGYYADPQEIVERARQALAYYGDYGAKYFDEPPYLVSKPNPESLPIESWSNGGSTQSNPLHAAEIVAALTALNFFSGKGSDEEGKYLIGGSNEDIPDKLSLGNLPIYAVSSPPDKPNVDPEKIFLATELLCHFLLRKFDWDMRLEPEAKLHHIYGSETPSGQKEDAQKYRNALNLIAASLRELAQPDTKSKPTGWSNQNALKITGGDTYSLGTLTTTFTLRNFVKWGPPNNSFERGAYLRHVWFAILNQFSQSVSQSA